MYGYENNERLRPVVEKIIGEERITSAEALVLWDEAPPALMGMLATGIKRQKSGTDVYYNRNFHIEPTNICRFRCKFCSYRREESSSEAWNHNLEKIKEIARTHASDEVTEVHIVGGVHPDYDIEYFCSIIRAVKSIIPHAVIKAFTAVELASIISRSGLSISEGLQILKKAGMEAIPGGGAEIFDEQIRAEICPDKGSTAQWLNVHEEAHKLGISTNATILYGHIETPEHRIDHLDRLRTLQDRTGGFNAFIPLKYRNYGNEMSAIGEVAITEDMRMIALSRIYLDNFPHIKAYWPMLGKTTTELALAFGADDIDGTISDTTKIYSMAGAEDARPSMSVEEIEVMVAAAGFRAVERDTFYNPVKK